MTRPDAGFYEIRYELQEAEQGHQTVLIRTRTGYRVCGECYSVRQGVVDVAPARGRLVTIRIEAVETIERWNPA